MKAHNYPPNIYVVRDCRDYVAAVQSYYRLKESCATAAALSADYTNNVLPAKERLERFTQAAREEFQKGAFAYFERATVQELEFNLRNYQREITAMDMTVSADSSLQAPINIAKKFFEDVVEDIKSAILSKGGNTVAQQQAARVASQVQTYLEAVRLLEEQCETDVRDHPMQTEEIRRRYRKAIDALKETA